jgi:membrane fusion protein (multidrug efflux system)
VSEIRFVEGASVRAGQLLVKLADDDLRARKKKLEQQLALESNRKQRLERLRAVDGASLDDYEGAVAQVAMRTAEIDEINAAIAKTEIRAPFSGVVGLRQVSLGAVIAPSTLLATLTNVNDLNIDCSVPERYTASLGIGSVLKFRVHGTDSVLRTARIRAFEPMVDTRTRTQRLRARIDDTRTLNAGAFADVMVALDEQPEAILLPSQAVVQDQSGATVYRVERGIARMIPVTLGGRTATHVHVLSGIMPGDTVVVSGILFVKNGQPVKAMLR